MATVRSVGVPAVDLSSPSTSPTASSTSLSTLQGGTDLQLLPPPPRPRARAHRSPARPLLRTGFRKFSGVVDVLVGSKESAETGGGRPQTKYVIHKELLTAASPFFAAALNGTFAEGLDQSVKLPEEKPEIFEWFLQWLYTGSLSIPHHGNNMQAVALNGAMLLDHHAHANAVLAHPLTAEALAQADGELRNSAGSPKYFLLIDLFALSDRLLATPLSNHILSTLARLSESTNSVPTPSDTWILYDGMIPDTSPLRTLVLDLFAYKKTDKLLETHKDEWHPRFLRDLVVKLKRPGPEALERHSLVAWRPRSWSTSKACEGCKETLKPGVSADKCASCEKVFCGGCLRRHGEGGGWTLSHDTSGCKPWMGRGLCRRYHDHGGMEACG